MDLDGFLKLHEARIAEATATADNALKLTQAEVVWQQANKAALENLSLLHNIQWDAQAHSSLQKQIEMARQRERALRIESDSWARKLQNVTVLVTGPLGIAGVQSAWIAFYWITQRVPAKITIAAMRTLKIDADAFSKDSWSHPFQDAVVLPYSGPKTAQEVFKWAAKHNYYPTQGYGAWEYVSSLLEAMSEACKGAADDLQRRVDLASKAALELSQIDWKRLNEGPRHGTENGDK